MTSVVPRGAGLRGPGSRRRQVRLLLSAFRILVVIEARARHTPTPVLCERMGVTFAGFTRPRQGAGSLSYDIREAWWAVEWWLRWWPWARGRACLRRSLALGYLLRRMGPAMAIDVITARPFQAHATLIVRGYQLDMGTTGEPLIGLSAR